MKRSSLFLSLALSASVLSGCGSVPETKDIGRELDSAFSCEMDMVYENAGFEGKITRYEAGRWDAEFTSPDTVSGVKLSFEGNEVSASYKGLAFTVPKSALPVKSLLVNLTDAVDKAAAEQQTECISKDGCLILEGETEQGKYSLCLDEKTCDLVSFSMENMKMKMNFKNTEDIGNSAGSEEDIKSGDITDQEEHNSTDK